ncbi:hypothetical protein G7046_g6460 [Stylonectria norvegica]|nr:hypothetical protein G7046_g6460 [Stylonectria norvegica]
MIPIRARGTCHRLGAYLDLGRLNEPLNYCYHCRFIDRYPPYSDIAASWGAAGTMVAKEFLDSDRVNYLVWRFVTLSPPLAHYREAAAKLQKEWHVKQPHREFAFARHVKSHALVSVINRGMLYYSLEREHARNQLPGDATAAAEELQVGIFGPLETHPLAKMEDDEDASGEEVEQWLRNER